MKNCALMLMVLIVILSGCSGGGSAKLSRESIGIKRVDEGGQVTYGMSRSDAENVLGTGEKKAFGFEYSDGVSIQYRDDKVVAVVLSEESDGIYQTIDGIKVGMLEDEIKKRYGKKYVNDSKTGSLDYHYDTNKGQFLTREDIKNSGDSENVFVLSVTFDDNGYAKRIMLLDQRAAKYGD
ncbi:hypothetical protein CM49_04364 [Paenibacillus sp. P1XP2]|nr:hypothetical protein CM49_04364 [Paenibacillus sp. P1XP2]